jgi:hypothetical protein
VSRLSPQNILPSRTTCSNPNTQESTDNAEHLTFLIKKYITMLDHAELVRHHLVYCGALRRTRTHHPPAQPQPLYRYSECVCERIHKNITVLWKKPKQHHKQTYSQRIYVGPFGTVGLSCLHLRRHKHFCAYSATLGPQPCKGSKVTQLRVKVFVQYNVTYLYVHMCAIFVVN